MAARRVAEENRQLRELLHKQGISDEYIAHYTQTTTTGHTGVDMSSANAAAAAAAGVAAAPGPGFPGVPGAGPGPSVQSLQQLLAPRRPASLDPTTPFPLAGQASREASITSASTSTSSLWDPQQQGIPAYSHHQPVNMAPGPMAGSSQYSTPVYSAESTPRVDAFTGQQTPQQQQQQQPQQQGGFPAQQMPGELPGPSANYSDPNAPFNPNPRDYGPPGAYC